MDVHGAASQVNTGDCRDVRGLASPPSREAGSRAVDKQMYEEKLIHGTIDRVKQGL